MIPPAAVVALLAWSTDAEFWTVGGKKVLVNPTCDLNVIGISDDWATRCRAEILLMHCVEVELVISHTVQFERARRTVGDEGGPLILQLQSRARLFAKRFICSVIVAPRPGCSLIRPPLGGGGDDAANIANCFGADIELGHGVEVESVHHPVGINTNAMPRLPPR